ncbi:hypothetical protein JM83_3653 [Gillisia sp. Hel_I_86]|nr:hypothetical protein JM83_3653 [Gillisia sp. Hel_I_86]
MINNVILNLFQNLITLRITIVNRDPETNSGRQNNYRKKTDVQLV